MRVYFECSNCYGYTTAEYDRVINKANPICKSCEDAEFEAFTQNVKWQTSKKGNLWCIIKGKTLTIFEDRFNPDCYTICISSGKKNTKFHNGYASKDLAIEVALEIMYG